MKYDVILADPPWDWKAWSKKGEGRSAKKHYPVMDMKKILGLPVYELADENCVLFIWGIWSMLPHCLDVIKAWGFEYKTEAWVWVKTTKSDPGKYPIGNGYYTRANTEYCLIATKGKMPVAVHNEIALIVSPRREHSRKPDEQYGKIERLYPNMRYLELFARHKHSEKWSVWGNEVDSDIDLVCR